MKTNVNSFSEEGGTDAGLKTETKGDDIREKIEDKAIRIIAFQNKALKVYAKHLKENLNYALTEAYSEKLDQK